MVEGRDLRESALERLQDSLPGLPPERYEAELDDALARIDEAQVGVRVRREQMIAESRGLDMINAVFAIHYYNRRYSGHVGEYGLGRIRLGGVLGDLFSREQIAEAVVRADALIEEGIRIRPVELGGRHGPPAPGSPRLQRPGPERCPWLGP